MYAQMTLMAFDEPICLHAERTQCGVNMNVPPACLALAGQARELS